MSICLEILGIKWNVVQDDVVFGLTKMVILMENTKPNKRCVERMPTRFYDPLEFM